MLATQLKTATDMLTAEVANVVQQGSASTPDADVQAGIDAVAKATSDLSTAFPKP